MRLCKDGEISSSVVLIFTIIETVDGGEGSVITEPPPQPEQAYTGIALPSHLPFTLHLHETGNK